MPKVRSAAGGSVRGVDLEFREEFYAACQKHQESFDSLKKSGGYILAVKPYGVYFAMLLFDYLRKRAGITRGLTLFLIDTEGKGLDRPNLRKDFLAGKTFFVVDDDVISGNTFRKIKTALRATGIERVTYLTWEDRAGLADIVLNSKQFIDKLSASAELGIHPEAFTRLCRHGMVPGAVQTTNGWKVEADKFEAFRKVYHARMARRPFGSPIA